MVPFFISPRLRTITGLLLLLLAPAVGFAERGGPDWPVYEGPKFWMIDAGSYHVGLDFDYLTTEENYDIDGETVDPSTLLDATAFTPRFNVGVAVRAECFGLRSI